MLTMSRALGLTGGAALAASAFSAFSRLRYQRSAIATLAEYGVRPIKMLNARTSAADRLARMASRPEPRRTLSFPIWSRRRYDVERREDDGMPVYCVRPHSASDTVVVYLHGGGYISTASQGQALLIDELTRRTGAGFIVPLYPLAPHHTWQEAHRLVLDLYSRTLSENPGKRIVLMGDSAGGGLAVVIALSLAEQGSRQPDELILLSPWVDITHTNPDIADYVDIDPLMAPEPLTIMGRSWAGDTPTTDWHLSPVNGDLSALHRVTTFVGSREIFLPDNALLHDRLVEAGVDSTLHIGHNLNHVYPMIPSPEGRGARREIARIILGRSDDGGRDEAGARSRRHPGSPARRRQIDQTGIASTAAVTG